MKIMAVNTKTAVATAIYYLAILTLLVFIGAVVYELLFWSPPPCVATGNICVVDSWSIAGLATMVLGVAATLLAILGAVAVAAWWTNLNTIVDKRVDEQAKGKIEEIKRTLSEEQMVFYTKQKKEFEATRSNMQNEIAELRKLVEGIGLTCDIRLERTNKDMILLAMMHEPWIMEEWAEVLLLQDTRSEIAIRMMIRYLKIVKELVSDDLSARTRCIEHLKMMSAPSKDYLYYWNAALKWKERVDNQKNPTYMLTAKDNVGRLRSKIEFMEKQAKLDD